MFEWLTRMLSKDQLPSSFSFSGAAAALDKRRLGAGCATGGSQGVGEQGDGDLDLNPSSFVLGIDLILGHSIAHE